MLPALARHLKPTLHSFSAGLADHFLLVARLWWAAPPDKLFHLPPSRDYEQHNLGGVTTRLLLLILFRVVLVCLSHLILLSGLGPVKWQTHSGSDLPLLNQQCDLWLWRRLDPFTFCFFSWDRAMWEPPVWCPWEIWQCKDMIVGLRLRRIVASTCGTQKDVCHPWCSSGMSTRRHWRTRREVWLEFQTRWCVSVLPACENRLKSYWPVQPGMCWTLSLRGGKSNSSSHLTPKKSQMFPHSVDWNWYKPSVVVLMIK